MAAASALLATAAPAQLAPGAPPSKSTARITTNDDAPTRLPPAYPVPYGGPSEQSVRAVLDRVLAYLDRSTPMQMVDKPGGRPVDLAHLDAQSRFAPGDFQLVTYEWGVTYGGMMLAGQVLGDPRYTRYAADRINFVADVAARYRGQPGAQTPVRGMIAPAALDDSGSMAAAMIKAQRAGLADPRVRPQIDVWLDYISHKQQRLADGTLARSRPLPETLWLDDVYMSVPALAQMGALTGERRYYDDAVRQVLQFSQRMFVPETGLYRHGWVQGMEPHPAFYWGRANGWAVMAMVELLDVLPADHPGRAAVLAQLRAHVAGLARVQGGNGLWHQLLDRPDSYYETSATAIYAYAIARAVNRGWLDAKAYGPVAVLAWNAVTTKVNAAGEVEDVCVGTGMGFDPAFYYYRPVHVRAAHGYGPVLLAGAEMVTLMRGPGAKVNARGGAVMF